MAKPLTTTPRATTVLPVRERYSDLRLFETFCPAAADVDKYATIVWYGLGLFGNLIAYRAWTGTSLRKGNSTAVYLAALSMCNLLFFLLHVVHELQFTWDVPTLNYPVVCELYYVGLGTAKSLSPALVLMAVGERWLAVCHPFSKANVLRRGRAKTIVFFLVAAAIGVNSARGYFWKYEYGTVRKCVPRLATYDASGAFTSYWFYGIITEVIAFGVVPLTTIFLAVGIVREMKRSNYRMLKSSFIGGSSPPNFYAPPMHTSCYEDFAAAPYGYYKHPATPYMMEPARPRRRPNKNANTSMLLTVAFYSSLASIPWSIAFGMAVLAPFRSENGGRTFAESVCRRLLPQSHWQTLPPSCPAHVCMLVRRVAQVRVGRWRTAANEQQRHAAASSRHCQFQRRSHVQRKRWQ